MGTFELILNAIVLVIGIPVMLLALVGMMIMAWRGPKAFGKFHRSRKSFRNSVSIARFNGPLVAIASLVALIISLVQIATAAPLAKLGWTLVAIIFGHFFVFSVRWMTWGWRTPR